VNPRAKATLAALAALILTGALAVWVTVGAAPREHDLKTGRALYLQYCVTCHGEAGKGDGPSAAGLGTKPSDLSDGRLMNALPAEFIDNIIANGGAAEGLAPTMPAFRGYLGEEQRRQIASYVRSLARPTYSADTSKSLVVVRNAPAQPIFFSHLIHAGSFGIACQYCHADARRSEYAGLPSVERCMGCHKIVGAADNPEIQKIHDYWKKGAPIPWVRVFKVPEFSYFPHKAHIRAGLECQQCHGPIERMRVVGADTGRGLVHDLRSLVGLRAPQRLLTMGWCVDCHRDQNARRGMKAPLDCVTCHH